MRGLKRWIQLTIFWSWSWIFYEVQRNHFPSWKCRRWLFEICHKLNIAASSTSMIIHVIFENTNKTPGCKRWIPTSAHLIYSIDHPRTVILDEPWDRCHYEASSSPSCLVTTPFMSEPASESFPVSLASATLVKAAQLSNSWGDEWVHESKSCQLYVLAFQMRTAFE